MKNQISRFLLGASLATLILACDSTDEADDEARGSSGGGSSGVASTDDALCTDACEHVVACAKVTYESAFDAAPCTAQCVKELAGAGYLDAEVARYGFEAKRTLGNDAGCSAHLDLFEEIYEGDYRMLSAVAKVDECQRAIDSSRCGQSAVEFERQGCFRLYVQYADKYRKQYEACGYPKQACDEYRSCIDGVTLPPELQNGKPWYGTQFAQ